MRTHVDWRSTSKENYNNFCKKHPSIRLTFDDWKNISYTFMENFKEYVLETGERVKIPYGVGDISINKKKRRKVKSANGKDYVNLPIDWKRTKEKGKRIYNFNFHTEGFFFGWKWFRFSSRFKFSDLWYFKPSRTTSRLLSHYIKTDEKYQHIYREWLK